MIPLTPGAEKIARIIGEGISAVIHNVLDGPTNCGDDALASRQASNIETDWEADGVDDDRLSWVVVEAPEGVIDVNLVVNSMDMLCANSRSATAMDLSERRMIEHTVEPLVLV